MFATASSLGSAGVAPAVLVAPRRGELAELASTFRTMRLSEWEHQYVDFDALARAAERVLESGATAAATELATKQRQPPQAGGSAGVAAAQEAEWRVSNPLGAAAAAAAAAGAGTSTDTAGDDGEPIIAVVIESVQAVSSDPDSGGGECPSTVCAPHADCTHILVGCFTCRRGRVWAWGLACLLQVSTWCTRSL
jgi:hypothetical protein